MTDNTRKSCATKPVMRQIILSMVAILVTFSIAAEPTSDDHISQLREEIRILERRMRESEAGEKDVIQQLQDIDHQIELRRRLVRELEQQVAVSSKKIRGLDKRIHGMEAQIEQLSAILSVEEAELNRLQQEVGARMVVLYKRMNSHQVALLIGSKNLNDLFERRHYIRTIERSDRAQIIRLRNQRNLVQKDRDGREDARQELVLEKARRLSEQERIRSLLQQRTAEENSLSRERGKKKELLNQISGDTELLRALLSERRKALESIEREIEQLEKRPAPMQELFAPDTPFESLAGKLPLPVDKMRIILPFGKIHHPELGTTTVNPGIDIAASTGDPVYAIAHGQVTRIAYLRGFGNTIILSHGTGYYTVYSRMGALRVTEGDIVSPRQNIGEVGEINAGEGFHFEVWFKRQTQDPMRWLIRGK